MKKGKSVLRKRGALKTPQIQKPQKGSNVRNNSKKEEPNAGMLDLQISSLCEIMQPSVRGFGGGGEDGNAREKNNKKAYQPKNEKDKKHDQTNST